MVILSGVSTLLAQQEPSRTSEIFERQVIGTDPAPSRDTVAEEVRFDALAFASSQQQLGPRGGNDEVFSTNFLQFGLTRDFGRGAALLRVTGSAEPLTVADPTYPALFQTARDREGNAVIDAQPAQRYLSEVAIGVGTDLGRSGALTVYAAPVGVPAFGTSPTRQRASAAYLARTPLRDHMQSFAGDASNVVTASLNFGPVTLEGSSFHYGPAGDEVTPDRGSMNARAARLRVDVTRNAFLQVSAAEGDDSDTLPTFDRRTSAGFSYARQFGRGGIAWTLTAAEERPFVGETLRAYTAEGRFGFGANTISLRGDSADTPALFDAASAPELAGATFRIDSYTIGYARDLWRPAGVLLSVGGEMTYYHAPRSFETFYGHKPQGSIFFLRFSPTRSRLALH